MSTQTSSEIRVPGAHVIEPNPGQAKVPDPDVNAIAFAELPDAG
jgi:hypothetical protein